MEIKYKNNITIVRLSTGYLTEGGACASIGDEISGASDWYGISSYIPVFHKLPDGEIGSDVEKGFIIPWYLLKTEVYFLWKITNSVSWETE